MEERDTVDPPIEYDPSSDTYRLPYDSSAGDSVGVVVAMGIAAIEDVDEGDLPPLDEVIDTEAVDELLAAEADESADSNVEVVFTYCGYRVTVNLGDVRLRSRNS